MKFRGSPHRPKRGFADPRAAVVWSLALGVIAAVLIAPSELGAQDPVGGSTPASGGPRVALVGDSIMLGAAPALDSSLRAAGFDPVIDAQEDRSTSIGADHVRMFAATGVDAIVVMLGANDSGDPDLYRARVAQVIEAADGVPSLYWMTIPEVRDYYPSSNAIVAEQLAARPGGVVLDWSAVSASGGFTSGDGMHLSSEGASAMGSFVALELTADLLAPSADAEPPEPPQVVSEPPADPPVEASVEEAEGPGDSSSSTTWLWIALVATAAVLALVLLSGFLGPWKLGRDRSTSAKQIHENLPS